MAEENILDEAIARIEDESLRQRIAREVELLRGSRRFGLVFDRHLPESVRLAEHPIRKDVTVGLRDESSPEVWRVSGFTDYTRQTALLTGGAAMTELRGGPNCQALPHRRQRTCRPEPKAPDSKRRPAEVGMHVSPSRHDRSADLLDKSVDDSSATATVARPRRHEWHQ